MFRLELRTSTSILTARLWPPGLSRFTMAKFLAQNALREVAMDTPANLKIALGVDHAGFLIKDPIKNYLLKTLGVSVLDFGTDSSTRSVDYPDFAGLVARSVADLESHFGVLACGTGLGIQIAANKYPGIIAANCRLPFDAKMARLHNAANIISFGAKVELPIETIQEMLQIFLTTKFEGGRHLVRVQKIHFPPHL